MGKTQKLPTSQKHLQLSIYNHQKALPISKRLITRIVKEILSFLQVDCKEVSIYFTTIQIISELHEQFFNDATPTDCISFPIDKEHLGEVFICPAVAIEYASKHDIDPLKETILYMIHGILHLIGYDDLDPVSKKMMRRMEKKCLNHIQFLL
ncbi:MAG TPA: rRNA maturation RNase YbeY [Chlamydiales bacterium]|nr:rRNA maturation RNase YbeY [Chlamydiales bacterium]